MTLLKDLLVKFKGNVCNLLVCFCREAASVEDRAADRLP